jgi:hypothetical protein
MAGCHGGESFVSIISEKKIIKEEKPTQVQFAKGSWQHFLRHLPINQKPIVNYKGEILSDQTKNAGVIDYDIGLQDLQQCADAIMRLRAEYLFAQNKQDRIGFHFTSGHYYSWNDYCKGKRPKVQGNRVQFYQTSSCNPTHPNLRRYLDIVYAYAGTISLAQELKDADNFSVGTIIITPGSPGHCTIIIDEAINEKGERLFKLAEGYTPAQSIYVVSNPYNKELNPWYRLEKGIIATSSYIFKNYQLKKFE